MNTENQKVHLTSPVQSEDLPPAPEMPTRAQALRKTALNLLPGRDDWTYVCSSSIGLLMFVASACALMARLVRLIAFPISAPLMYLHVRRNQRRWYAYACKQKKEREALVAELEESCRQPIVFAHEWFKSVDAQVSRDKQ